MVQLGRMVYSVCCIDHYAWPHNGTLFSACQGEMAVRWEYGTTISARRMGAHKKMRFTLQGAHLVDASTDQPHSAVTVDGSQIVAVGNGADDPGVIIDGRDMIVMPGFIDIHTHGGGGFSLHTTDVGEIHSYARWAPTTGVTAFLVAVVGVPDSLPEPQLRTASEAIEVRKAGAEPLGIFLEGPYINVARRGAHPPNWLRMPEAAETERILRLARGHLRLITLAPELSGADDLICSMVAAGVTVSIGHTDATYEQAQAAFALGVTHVTHCCNAMRPLQHRAPGPLGALTQYPNVYGELIADGVHVHPAMMNVVAKILGPTRTIAITDAQAAAGMGNISFDFAGQPAWVIDGAAHLADGTLTGSVLTMDRALRNMISMTHASLSHASAMLTANPAASIHCDTRKGRLRPGHDADLVVLDHNLMLHATICNGKLEYVTSAWQAQASALM